MDLTFPAHAVVSTLDAEVLLTLAGTTLPMTGNQVRRVTGKGSLRGVQLVLQRLERHGLIDVRKAGSSNLYSLNRDHVAIPAVLALVDLRGQLFRRISNEMNTWSIQPIAVAVFGSAARGDGGLVVRKSDPEQDQRAGHAYHIYRKESTHYTGLHRPTIKNRLQP